MKVWLRVAVTLLLCALLLVYVADIRAVMETLSRCDPFWTAVALMAFTVDRIVMSYKWGLLLTIRGYAISLVQRLMIYCSAMMWGLALPSTVGADGIRVVLVRRFGVRVDDALATILVERGIGFVVALLTTAASLVILNIMLPHSDAYGHALLICVVGLLVAITILIFSFTSDALNSVMRLLPHRIAASRAAQMLGRLHDAYRSLAADRPRLAAFSVLTLVEHLLIIISYGLVTAALKVEFNALFLFAAVPLAILVSRLPISLDGIGVYESIFVAIMALGGVRPADALAVSLAGRALQIVVWLPWWAMLAVRTGAVRPPTESTATSSTTT